MQRPPLVARLGLCAAVLLLANPGRSADPPKESPKIDLDLIPDPDIEWMKRSKVATDSPGLIAFLKSCQGKEIPPADIDAEVAKLMTGTKAEQGEAARKLAEFGTIAVPTLRKHRTDANADGAKRVRECLEKIEEVGDKPLARPAIRRLSLRKSPGTLEALLGYLPFASDPAAEEDIYYELDSLIERAQAGDKGEWNPWLQGPSPLYRKHLQMLAGYLKDVQPARRALAACILGRRGNAEERQAVRDLLKDPDGLVRLRAAQGLLAGRDAVGVSTLIDLLADPSIEIAWQAEELLRWLSNETAPDTVLGGDGKPEASARVQSAWREWSKTHPKIDFAELENEPRRPLLLLGYDRAKGKVWLFGSDGVTRCEWNTKANLADAQYVPGGTVLTLHEQSVCEKPLLAERDRAGNVLWGYEDMVNPQYCQRLGNGNVFVAERQDAMTPYLRYQILNPGGKVVARQPASHSGPVRSHALRMGEDGRIACAVLHNFGNSDDPRIDSMDEFDPSRDFARQIRKRFGSQKIGPKLYVESAEGGGYLLSGFAQIRNRTDNMVLIDELDRDGDQPWNYQVIGATHAFRLRGKDTIVCAIRRVLEVSTDRRNVGEISMSQVPSVARPCLSFVRFGFDSFATNIDLGTAVDYRVKCLEKKDARTRLFALQQLAELRFYAAYAIPKLKPLSEDPDPAVRDAARKTLAEIGADEIPRLATEAKDADPERRVKAINRLGRFRDGPGVVNALLEALKDSDPRVRYFAASAFSAFEPSQQSRDTYLGPKVSYLAVADRVLPELVKALGDPDAKVRESAARTLGFFGPTAKTAIAALIGVMKNDAAPAVRATAATSLGKMGGDRRGSGCFTRGPN